MPLIYHKQLPNHTQLGVWKVEETIEDLRSRLILDDEELAFYHRLNKGKRNLHWLSSRVLIRNLLNTDHFIEVKGDEYGKPHLVNFPYELSITHSQDFAAVMISKNRVGVDIEEIRPKIKRIAHKFATEQELAMLSTDEAEAIRELFVIWTGKETLYKLYGKREMNFRRHMSFEPFKLGSPGSAKGWIRKSGLEQQFSVTFEELNGYMLAYSIEGY
jgi:4'-phosphopantetheinyl transferase